MAKRSNWRMRMKEIERYDKEFLKDLSNNMRRGIIGKA
jgi:hypothetical protein